MPAEHIPAGYIRPHVGVRRYCLERCVEARTLPSRRKLFGTAGRAGKTPAKKLLASLLAVPCFVEKAGFEPRTLGTKAERHAHCATRPVEDSSTPEQQLHLIFPASQ